MIAPLPTYNHRPGCFLMQLSDWMLETWMLLVGVHEHWCPSKSHKGGSWGYKMKKKSNGHCLWHRWPRGHFWMSSSKPIIGNFYLSHYLLLSYLTRRFKLKSPHLKRIYRPARATWLPADSRPPLTSSPSAVGKLPWTMPKNPLKSLSTNLVRMDLKMKTDMSVGCVDSHAREYVG